MKDNGEKIVDQRERFDALINFVTRQAQEALLHPNLPKSYQDEVVNAAIGTIQNVAEKKAAYYAKYGDGRKIRRPNVIYEASDHENEEQEETPLIIAELNENLKISDEPLGFTVEAIAERVGINKRILYEWVEGDEEFTNALESLKEVQKNDPFKTGTEEDVYVNSMMVALLLLETRERHFRSQNQ